MSYLHIKRQCVEGVHYLRNGILQEEHEGTKRDTPSHGFVICQSLKLFIDWLTNGSAFSETSALRLRLVRKSERRAFGYR